MVAAVALAWKWTWFAFSSVCFVDFYY